MVRSEGGQLYTIEGIAAALIMIITAYMVVNATSVYTAGDTHISDMQLEQIGSDALTMMDIKDNSDDASTTLQEILKISDPGTRDSAFDFEFQKLITAGGTIPSRDIQYYATYTCRKDFDDSTYPTEISSSDRGLTGTEHPVRVTKWVIVRNEIFCGDNAYSPRDRAVLVEVLLWLD